MTAFTHHDMTIAEKLSLAVREHTAGKLPAAEAIYRDILAAQPNHADALHLLGVVLHQTGRTDQACELLKQAIAANPKFAGAHNNLGSVLREQGELDGAATHYRRAAELQPDLAEAHYNLANVLVDQGELSAAAQSYRRAIELKPDFSQAHNRLGNVLSDLGRYAEAVASYQTAGRLQPDLADVHNNLGCAFKELGKIEQAVACYRTAIERAPDFAEAHNNLGAVLRDQGRLDEALACCQTAVRIKPDLAAARNNLGNILDDAGRHTAACSEYEQAIQLDPEYADAHNNLAMLRLLHADFAGGWPAYEWRLKTKASAARDFDAPRWDGAPIPDKTLLIHAEQGFGDTLQFCRYVEFIKPRVGRVVMVCQRALARLLSNVAGIDHLLTFSDPLPPFDFHIHLLSIPGLVGTDGDSIPNRVPYVSPDPALLTHWHDQLQAIAGFRVGIAWQGSPTYPRDRFRSIPLAQFAPLAELPGVRLISLQKGYGHEQVEQVARRFEVIQFPRLDEASGPFMDTAALMQHLDLFITSDTAVAHLAGALGVPVWVALPAVPDWRWQLARQDSPWYPSVRLFRQTERGQWGPVFERIRVALEQAVDRRRQAGARQTISTKPQTHSAPAKIEGPMPRESTQNLLAQAMREHTAGRLPAAEAAYRAILAQEPRNPDALHLLGVVLHQQSRNDDAVTLIRQAIEVNPDWADFHLNLGNVLSAQGNLNEAETSFQRAVQLDPKSADKLRSLGNVQQALGKLDAAVQTYQRALAVHANSPEVLNNLGTAQLSLGQVDQAVESYARALRIKPDYARAHYNLGHAWHKQGNLDEAAASYRRATQLQPDFSQAFNSLGNVLREQHELEEAVTSYRRVLELNPSLAEAHNNLGNALGAQKKREEAIASLRTAVRLKPEYYEAYNNLGTVLHADGQLDEAVACYERALSLKPDFAGALSNLGSTLREQGKLDAAIDNCQRAVQLGPEVVEARTNLAISLSAAGRHQEAIAAYDAALSIEPDNPDVRHNRAMHRLSLGDFAGGWPEFEWRTRVGELKPREFQQPRWDGTALADQTLLIHAEQGFGDTIQFIRFATLVKQRVGRVVVLCQKRIKPLLSDVAAVDGLIADGDRLPDFDVQLPMLSLPHVLQTGDELLADQVPYVSVSPALQQQWRDRIVQAGRFQVGISWQGNREYAGDRLRSIPLRYFAELAGLPGVDLISLQKGYGTEQLDPLRDNLDIRELGDDFDVTPFLDTAAVMKNLDLFITSDTAVAHLAGALGVRVWVVLQKVPDWRWQLDREDNPWYPTMRLFRQREWGDWSEVFHRLRGELARLVTGACPQSGSGDDSPRADPTGRHSRLSSDRTPRPGGQGTVAAATPPRAAAPGSDQDVYAPDTALAASDLPASKSDVTLRHQLETAFREHRAGNIGPAAAACRAFLDSDPDHPDALHLLGAILYQQGQLEPAREAISRAIEVKPDLAAAHNTLGSVLKDQGDIKGAIECLERALRLDPELPHAEYNLGNVFKAAGKVDLAIDHYRRAIALDSSFRQAHNNLGTVLAERGELEEAVSCFKLALQIEPGAVPQSGQLGIAAESRGEVDSAQSNYAEAFNNLGNALMDLNQLDQAAASFKRALEIKPGYAEAQNNQGMLQLMRGDFERGWAGYEWRTQLPSFGIRDFDVPRWDGSWARDKTILVHCEQGLGDTLQFARFLKYVRERTGRVVLLCHPPLSRLLASTDGVDQLVTDEAALPKFDLHLPLMSLPGVLGTTVSTIPAHVPYLDADSNSVQHWRQRLDGLNGFRIGICWQGSPEYRGDRTRSIPLTHFGRLAELAAVRLISLQKGHGLAQLAAARGKFSIEELGPDLDTTAGAFMDTAAVMKSLDLVVTCDTAIAHLAGALGVKVWVALPMIPDWRWQLGRSDSPWYPSMRLFRQPRRDDWDAVFLQMRDELARQLRGAAAVPAAGPCAGQSTSRGVDTQQLANRLELALREHNAGNFSTAETLCREVLAEAADHPDALHLLGVVHYQTERRPEAIELLQRAISVKKDFAGAHNNLGNVFRDELRFDEAVAHLRQAVQLEPEFAEAHYNLGNALRDRGRLNEAAESYRNALRIKPDFSKAHNNLGSLLLTLGQADQAVACFESVLELKPDWAPAYNNLGNALGKQGKLDDAVTSYQQALNFDPVYADAYSNMGCALRDQGRLDEALASYQRALELRPDFAEALGNLGDVFRELGRLDEALESCQRAVQLQPDFAGGHNNLGNVLDELGRHEAAVNAYQEALRLEPEFAEAHANLGNAWRNAKQLEPAREACERALALQPDCVAGHNNLANVCNDQGLHEEAEAHYLAAIELKPAYYEAFNGLGNALSRQGRRDQARASYERAIQIQPEKADAHKNLGMLQLLCGDFDGGWREYEWRLKSKLGQAPGFGQPRWDGARAAEQSLLVYAEQGLGDSIQFIRYVPLAKQRVGRLIVLCQQPLRRLFASLEGADVLLDDLQDGPEFDCQVPLLSLPCVMGTSADSIPADVPYLAADPALVRRWRTRLEPLAGFRIGIVWQGSRDYAWDRFRSFPLSCYMPLSEMPGVRLISLQKGDGAEQVAQLRDRMDVIELNDLDESAGPFMDTAAVMRNLDLVVTPDTAVAHLAGALGVRVWLALAHVPDWRWQLEREDCPWYPTMRLFRQQTEGDWGGVFERMRGALNELLK